MPAPDEADVDRALALRTAAIQGEVVLKVPSLWLFEVGNILTQRVPEHALEVLKVLSEFGLEESVPTDEWLVHTVTLSHQCGVTFYDAAYHATTIVENGLFVTADRKYVVKAEKAGAVILLNDWS